MGASALIIASLRYTGVPSNSGHVGHPDSNEESTPRFTPCTLLLQFYLHIKVPTVFEAAARCWRRPGAPECGLNQVRVRPHSSPLDWMCPET